MENKAGAPEQPTGAARDPARMLVRFTRHLSLAGRADHPLGDHDAVTPDYLFGISRAASALGYRA
jgi:hypothetical protein